MQTERRVAANTQTKPVDYLGCESAENWQLPSASTIAAVCYCGYSGGCGRRRVVRVLGRPSVRAVQHDRLPARGTTYMTRDLRGWVQRDLPAK